MPLSEENALRLMKTAALALLLIVGIPATGQEQNDALIERALEGDLDVVRSAIANGADVNTVSRNRASLLMAAAVKNHLALSRFLLTEGADPDLPNADGRTALFVVSMVGHAEIVELLLEFDANPNSTTDGIYNTPLMIAVINNNPETVRMLLAAGADMSIENSEGHTVFDIVDPDRQPEIAALLRQKN